MQSLLRRFHLVIFDKNFADAGSGSSTSWAGDLQLKNLAVFCALIAHVIADFCTIVSVSKVQIAESECVPSYSSLSISSSGVTIFIKQSTRLFSESVDVVPASMVMAPALRSISACCRPVHACLSFNLDSPISMPFKPSIAVAVLLGSAYSQKAMLYKLLVILQNHPE